MIIIKPRPYWAALSLSFRQISIMLMNIIAWGPQVTVPAWNAADLGSVLVESLLQLTVETNFLI